MTTRESADQTKAPAPATEQRRTSANITPRRRDDLFYKLVAGAAQTRLLESMLDLHLVPLLVDRGPLTATEIADALGLHLKRAAKWLVLLERIGLLRADNGHYRATDAAIAMCWDHEGHENFFARDMVDYCRRVNVLDFVEVLRGQPLPEAVRWPPRTKDAAAHLEYWMTVTANEAVAALERGSSWQDVRSLLDVGGGDATIACALARRFPNLHVTVFNLPASAELARARIKREKLEARVSVVEGNFLEDPLPKGFDRVQFSRVLADWDPAVCQRLLRLARAALRQGGSVVISEPFDDTNADLAVSWEFRYTFYDDFGVKTYKSVTQYTELLKQAGFSDFKLVDRVADTLYGVITAQ